MSPEPAAPLTTRMLRAAAGVPLDPQQTRAFLSDLAETNRRRLKVVLPIMLIGHVIHVAVFWVSEAQHAALGPTVVTWRQGIAAAHLLALCVAAPLTLAAYRLGQSPWVRWLGPIGALNYLLHGAACSSIDQLTVTAISPWIGYCVGVAVMQYHTPRGGLTIYSLGLAAFVAGIQTFQQDPSARLAGPGPGFDQLAGAACWHDDAFRRAEALHWVEQARARADHPNSVERSGRNYLVFRGTGAGHGSGAGGGLRPPRRKGAAERSASERGRREWKVESGASCGLCAEIVPQADIVSMRRRWRGSH